MPPLQARGHEVGRRVLGAIFSRRRREGSHGGELESGAGCDVVRVGALSRGWVYKRGRDLLGRVIVKGTECWHEKESTTEGVPLDKGLDVVAFASISS